MASTIYDVAKRAGVGIGTVSRAINNSPNINPETKQRVLLAVKELHYQPHALAQGLARKRTHMIAIVMPVFTGYFYLELLKAIQREATEYGYDLILYNVDEADKTSGFLKRTLREKRVDGVILISLKIPDPYAGRFTEKHFPIVLVDSHHRLLDSITVENEEGAYQATCHLIRQGHQKIGMIDAQLKSAPAKIRLNGFKRAMDEHNIPFREEYLVISNKINERDGFNREAGYHAMKQILELGDARPSAVFIASDIQAAGAIQAIREAGLNTPQDIALIGFDDIELATYLGITTMHQPLIEMGALAFRRLIERIHQPELKAMHKVFHTELVVRQTCGS